mmetsp:Transcript_22084/g.49979  ORF Transcript_22084/g.49979 Transcript_22084/m.49979 type:complete len:251 (+) Transcript_22084:194-946(+)
MPAERNVRVMCVVNRGRMRTSQRPVNPSITISVLITNLQKHPVMNQRKNPTMMTKLYESMVPRESTAFLRPARLPSESRSVRGPRICLSSAMSASRPSSPPGPSAIPAAAISKDSSSSARTCSGGTQSSSEALRIFPRLEAEAEAGAGASKASRKSTAALSVAPSVGGAGLAALRRRRFLPSSAAWSITAFAREDGASGHLLTEVSGTQPLADGENAAAGATMSANRRVRTIGYELKLSTRAFRNALGAW